MLNYKPTSKPSPSSFRPSNFLRQANPRLIRVQGRLCHTVSSVSDEAEYEDEDEVDEEEDSEETHGATTRRYEWHEEEKSRGRRTKKGGKDDLKHLSFSNKCPSQTLVTQTLVALKHLSSYTLVQWYKKVNSRIDPSNNNEPFDNVAPVKRISRSTTIDLVGESCE